MLAVASKLAVGQSSSRRRVLLLTGLTVAAIVIVGSGSGRAQPSPGCSLQLQSAHATRTGPAEDVELTVTHTNTCRAAITVTAADGTFQRIPIGSGARRAFRLDAFNLCRVAPIERALRPPGLSARALRLRGACEQDVLALAVEPLSSPGPGITAVRSAQTCVIAPVFERLRSASARAKREAIPVTVTVVHVINPPGTPGGPFLESDDVRVRLSKPSDPKLAAPIANPPADKAQLSECDAR
jgi:hypothetical protein